MRGVEPDVISRRDIITPSRAGAKYPPDVRVRDIFDRTRRRLRLTTVGGSDVRDSVVNIYTFEC